MRTTGLLKDTCSVIPFGLSLFLKVSFWEFNCYIQEGSHCKGKRCYFGTGDIVLMVENL